MDMRIPLRALRRVAKSTFGAVGLEVHRKANPWAGIGNNPFRDLQALVTHRSPLIFDVGANEGQTITQFRRRFQDPVIHAFEPSTRVFPILKRAFHTRRNVFLNPFALGARPERKVFLENSVPVMNSFLENGKAGWGEIIDRVEVGVATVDQYCAEHQIKTVDILKTDTQGYDLEVLKGAREMLSRNAVRLILTEVNFAELYDGMATFDQLFGFLRQHGFRLLAFYKMRYINNCAGWTDAVFFNPNYLRVRG